MSRGLVGCWIGWKDISLVAVMLGGLVAYWVG